MAAEPAADEVEVEKLLVDALGLEALLERGIVCLTRPRLFSMAIRMPNIWVHLVRVGIYYVALQLSCIIPASNGA